MRRGVSILELLLVLLILGTLAGLAIPRFGGSLVRYRVEQAADRVARDLAAARELARASSSNVTISFDANTNRYTIPALPDPDHPNDSYGVDLSAQPYEADLSNAAFGVNKNLTFNGYGLPDNDGAVTVVVGDEIRYVLVSSDSGAISVSTTQIFSEGVGEGVGTPAMIPLSP